MISSLAGKFLQVYDKTRFDHKAHFDQIAYWYLKDQKKILDLGCGTGRFIKKNPEKIIGLDLNQNALDMCRSKNFKVKHGSATDIPFEDNSFDGVHCSHLIEHLMPEEAHKLLCEINRVLTKDGVFVLRTPLMSERFYWNFTHIKPYCPEAVLHYLQTENQRIPSCGSLKRKIITFLGTEKQDAEKNESAQRTLREIDGEYEVIGLQFRRARLLQNVGRDSFWAFLIPLLNLLHRYGISTLKKTAYLMALRKVN